jgi:hypothetical protein
MHSAPWVILSCLIFLLARQSVAELALISFFLSVRAEGVDIGMVWQYDMYSKEIRASLRTRNNEMDLGAICRRLVRALLHS